MIPTELKAQEGYNARERRALAVRAVGVDTVPLPSWISGSQAAGRGGGGEYTIYIWTLDVSAAGLAL